jgi:hypothetical protein
MPIYRLLERSAFGPEQIALLVEAYENALLALHLDDRIECVKELVAKKIIELGQRGMRDPNQISTVALKELALRSDRPRAGSSAT